MDVTVTHGRSASLADKEAPVRTECSATALSDTGLTCLGPWVTPGGGIFKLKPFARCHALVRSGQVYYSAEV